jgi:hypothetical protein
VRRRNVTDTELAQFADAMGVAMDEVAVTDETIERWLAEKVKGLRRVTFRKYASYARPEPGAFGCDALVWHPLSDIAQAIGMTDDCKMVVIDRVDESYHCSLWRDPNQVDPSGNAATASYCTAICLAVAKAWRAKK